VGGEGEFDFGFNSTLNSSWVKTYDKLGILGPKRGKENEIKTSRIGKSADEPISDSNRNGKNNERGNGEAGGAERGGANKENRVNENHSASLPLTQMKIYRLKTSNPALHFMADTSQLSSENQTEEMDEEADFLDGDYDDDNNNNTNNNKNNNEGDGINKAEERLNQSEEREQRLRKDIEERLAWLKEERARETRIGGLLKPNSTKKAEVEDELEEEEVKKLLLLSGQQQPGSIREKSGQHRKIASDELSDFKAKHSALKEVAELVNADENRFEESHDGCKEDFHLVGNHNSNNNNNNNLGKMQPILPPLPSPLAASPKVDFASHVHRIRSAKESSKRASTMVRSLTKHKNPVVSAPGTEEGSRSDDNLNGPNAIQERKVEEEEDEEGRREETRREEEEGPDVSVGNGERVRLMSLPPLPSPKSVFIEKYTDFTTQVHVMRRAKDVAKKASEQSRVFLLSGSGASFVRSALQSRGWLQKVSSSCTEWEDVQKQIESSMTVERFYKRSLKAITNKNVNNSKQQQQQQQQQQQEEEGSNNSSSSSTPPLPPSPPPEVRLNNTVKIRQLGLGRQLYRTEAIEITNMVKSFVPNLFWTNSKSPAMLQLVDFRPDIIWNHYASTGGSFVTKEGLTTLMRDVHWKLDVDKDEITPRSYNLSRWEDKLDFVVDYKVTACTNLLKYVAENYRGEEEMYAGAFLMEKESEEEEEEEGVVSGVDDDGYFARDFKGFFDNTEEISGQRDMGGDSGSGDGIGRDIGRRLEMTTNRMIALRNDSSSVDTVQTTGLNTNNNRGTNSAGGGKTDSTSTGGVQNGKAKPTTTTKRPSDGRQKRQKPAKLPKYEVVSNNDNARGGSGGGGGNQVASPYRAGAVRSNGVSGGGGGGKLTSGLYGVKRFGASNSGSASPAGRQQQKTSQQQKQSQQQTQPSSRQAVFRLPQDDGSKAPSFQGDGVESISSKTTMTTTTMTTTTGVFPAPLSARIMELVFIQIEAILSHAEHEDIDRTETLADVTGVIASRAWPRLLKYIDEIISGSRILNLTPVLMRRCRSLLAKIRPIRKQLGIDGFKNMWILKPPSLSRGRGIAISQDLNEILNLSSSSRLVCQKYIERPLTIYDTKFDIRQWFLVTSYNPLRVWWYGDCYVRFSSQIFDLANFDESIHLTNNAVQANYKNQTQRSSRLPEDNMWDSKAFAQFCRERTNGEDVFRTTTLPRMKEEILVVLRGATEFMLHRQNSFELYGADFMVDASFHPWLIEINSSPALGGTTSITKRLCRSVCEDAMKVVLDKRLNPSAGTGGFELLHQGRGPSNESLLRDCNCCALLKVNGTSVTKPVKEVESLQIRKKQRPWKP